MKTPIFGPFDVSRSRNLADNDLINLYPEIDEAKGAKSAGALFSTPGLTLKATVGGGPVRAMRPRNDTLYVVSGGYFYSVAADWSAQQLGGGIALDAPVSILDNGTALAVFAGATAFTWSSAGGFNPIVLPFVPGGNMSAAYQDGFALVNQPNSTLFFQSELLDLASWDALNFGDASGDPDDIVGLAQLDREIWIIKHYETEIWYNAGTAGLTFGRLDGVYIESGCAALGSIVKSGETLIWLAKNSQGETVVVQTQGHQLKRISTHALEARWQAFSSVSDATAYAYQQGGHKFYVISFPSGNETWACDITDTELTKTPMWHRRAAYDNITGNFNRHFGNCQALFNGMVVIGDYRNGNLYELDPDALTDAGVMRKWLRSWRALAEPVNRPVGFAELRIDMQTGIDIAADANPLAVLRWSDDGGHTWSPERFSPVGRVGETAKRVMFRRLGSTRRNNGLDRIFELSSSDQFPVAIVGAELEAA